MASFALDKSKAQEKIRILDKVIGQCASMRAYNEIASVNLTGLANTVESEIKLSGIGFMKPAIRNLNNDITNNIELLLQACNSKKKSLERQIEYWTELELESSQDDSWGG